MAAIELRDVSKRFGSAPAVADLSLRVASGAFLALLGPSGCGKTTLLRLIAGLERPDGGTIRIGGRVVADEHTFVEPEDRGLGMVFQSYALWPHMSVAGNVGFGLQGRGLARAEQRRRASEALALVGLEAEAARRPHELSGGQRQRVALARSLALRPELILLDEPLANLDAGLRAAMGAEFRRIHRETGTTFVFVTHDQNEAMALASAIAVLDRGRLEQVADPETLYRRPQSAMVARFVGDGRLLPVEVLEGAGGDGRCAVRLGSRTFRVPGEAPAGPGWLCLRADDLAPGASVPADAPAHLPATVRTSRFENGAYRLDVALPDAPETGLTLRSSRPAEPGTPLAVAITSGWVLARASPP